jgi:hypothetical protein
VPASLLEVADPTPLPLMVVPKVSAAAAAAVVVAVAARPAVPFVAAAAAVDTLLQLARAAMPGCHPQCRTGRHLLDANKLCPRPGEHLMTSATAAMRWLYLHHVLGCGLVVKADPQHVMPGQSH